jgi:hypothetical protein
MNLIPFGQVGPDRSEFDPNFCSVIENVFPASGSFTPFPRFDVFSTAMPARPQGAFLAVEGSGSWSLFTGTSTALYKFNGATLGWTDVSGAGAPFSLADDGKWSFRQFGDIVVAANGVNDLQSYDLSTPTTFAPLSATAPRSKYLEVLGDFLLAVNLTTNDRGIHWSGLNDATFWTPRQRSSDFQIFPDDGEIQGTAAGPNGIVIFHEHCIREGALDLESPLVMRFRKTVDRHGSHAAKSIVTTGGGTFYLSQEGFYKYGTPPIGIGVDRVDRFFWEDVAFNEIFNVYGSEDPERKIVYWAYGSKSNTLPRSYDKVLAYHYGIDRWSLLRPGIFMTGLIDAVTPGYTMETLDSLGYTMETLPFSLDSRAWTGSLPTLAAFNDNFELGFFSGSPLQAILQTGDVAMSAGKRTFVNGFRPLTDAPTSTGRVAVKDYAGQARSWKASNAISTRTGLIPARASGRFHRFEVTIPAGATWGHIHGVEPAGTSEGEQ